VLKMKKDIIKIITQEMRNIEQDNDVSAWDYAEIDKMDGGEAYVCGQYEMLLTILKELD